MPGGRRAPCPTCGSAVLGAYCSACGEKRFDRHSLSLRHFFEHAFENFAHFDGTIFRTLTALVFRPGRLTADYVRGARKPYLAPVQLFLIANLIYFAAVAMNGWNTLTTDLGTHVGGTLHSSIARRMVDEKLAASEMEFSSYRQTFDERSKLQAKSLVILMSPVFALAVALFRLRPRRSKPKAGDASVVSRYVAEHLVFSVHFFAFFLLYLSVINSLTTLALLGMSRQGLLPKPNSVDLVVSLLTLSVLWFYLTLAVRRVDRLSKAGSLLTGFALTASLVAVLMIYRFVLFLVTFSTT